MANRFNDVRNRGDHVRRSQVLGQVTGRILCRIGIEACGHVHEVNILRSNRFGIKRSRDSAIDTATCTNDHARDMEHLQVFANHEHECVVNFSNLTRIRLCRFHIGLHLPVVKFNNGLSFAKERHFKNNFAIAVKHAATASKSVNVLTGIVRSNAVHTNDRHRTVFCQM